LYRNRNYITIVGAGSVLLVHACVHVWTHAQCMLRGLCKYSTKLVQHTGEI